MFHDEVNYHNKGAL